MDWGARGDKKKGIEEGARGPMRVRGKNRTGARKKKKRPKEKATSTMQGPFIKDSRRKLMKRWGCVQRKTQTKKEERKERRSECSGWRCGNRSRSKTQGEKKLVSD